MTLADLLPTQDYSFSMRFERGTFAEFFRPTSQHEELMTQRKHWLNSDPETYAALLPEGEPLLEEAFGLAQAEGTFPSNPAQDSITAVTPLDRAVALGMNWEPDFLLLQPDPTGTTRLLGGCVCFPSHWSLKEKLGLPVQSIHGVVPGLNPAIGQQIARFLTKLRPGIAHLRANWGLSRSSELNQHPERNLPRLDPTVRPEEVWFRVEHQALLSLPRTLGVLFGIRLAVHPLSEILGDSRLAQGLSRALKTMPEAMAQYKGLTGCRECLLSWLGAAD